MKNKLIFLIYSLCLMGTFILLSDIYAFGQGNNKTVKDIDGNVYKTILIGTQTWMAEDLKTTKYCNGNSIGTTTPATLDINSQINPKYQWAYDGNESNVATYGRLYTWYAATDSRGICPSGWHVPSDAEWATLKTFLGGESVAGGKLKEAGTTHWQTPNSGATNSSFFTALPGGDHGGNGTFTSIGYYGYWWSSTEYDTNVAGHQFMIYNSRDMIGLGSYKPTGYSVRCIRDNRPLIPESRSNENIMKIDKETVTTDKVQNTIYHPTTYKDILDFKKINMDKASGKFNVMGWELGGEAYTFITSGTNENYNFGYNFDYEKGYDLCDIIYTMKRWSNSNGEQIQLLQKTDHSDVIIYYTDLLQFDKLENEVKNDFKHFATKSMDNGDITSFYRNGNVEMIFNRNLWFSQDGKTLTRHITYIIISLDISDINKIKAELRPN